MKHIPNIITLSRIVLSLLLIVFLKQSVIFLILYLLCGLSDILDGILARKLKAQSELGAKLDSIADLLLFGIILFSLFQLFGTDLIKFVPYLTLIIVIRGISLIFAAIRYHTFLILHTLGNKLTGIIIYLSIALYIPLKQDLIVYIVLFIAALSALEELLIHITSKNPDPNRRGLLWK